MLILFAELFRVMRLLDARLRIRSALVFLLCWRKACWNWALFSP